MYNTCTIDKEVFAENKEGTKLNSELGLANACVTHCKMTVIRNTVRESNIIYSSRDFYCTPRYQTFNSFFNTQISDYLLYYAQLT